MLIEVISAVRSASLCREEYGPKQNMALAGVSSRVEILVTNSIQSDQFVLFVPRCPS